MFAKGGPEHSLMGAILQCHSPDTDELRTMCEAIGDVDEVIARLTEEGCLFLAADGSRTTVILTLKGQTELAQLDGRLPAIA